MRAPVKSNLAKLPFLSAFICFVLILPANSFAQKDRIDTFIENSMARQRIVGFAVGIIKDGKVIKTKGYGYSNLELNIRLRPIPFLNWVR